VTVFPKSELHNYTDYIISQFFECAETKAKRFHMKCLHDECGNILPDNFTSKVTIVF
jgi:hypothetical protein